jgi:translation initiation factor IF-2
MTKRVYEVAKELGVSASDIIKTLGEHNIKATNFSGVDDQAKHVLDKAYAPKKEHADAHGARKKAAMQAGKNNGQNARKNEQRTEKNNKNRNARPQNNQGHRPETEKGNAKKEAQPRNNFNRQQQNMKKNQQTNQNNQGNQNTNHKANGNGKNGSQPAHETDTKRTKYFGHSQQNNAGRNDSRKNNKHGGSAGHNGKNGPGSQNRPHTLLSNVLNKGKNKNKRNKNQHGGQHAAMQEAPSKKKNYPTSIELPETIIVKDFAERLGREVSEVIKKLLMGGIMATINQEIDYDTASLIADEFGVAVTKEAPPEDPTEIEEIIDPPESLQSRVRLSSPSWATSTTARRVCSTLSVRVILRATKPAALPSISGRIRSATKARKSYLHGYAGARSLYGYACPRCPGNGYCRPRRRSR